MTCMAYSTRRFSATSSSISAVMSLNIHRKYKIPNKKYRNINVLNIGKENIGRTFATPADEVDPYTVL
jgi:hypothetical protein